MNISFRLKELIHFLMERDCYKLNFSCQGNRFWKVNVCLQILVVHYDLSIYLEREREWVREIINDVLLWTPTYGYTNVDQPAKTYIYQLCADTGCRLHDFASALVNRDGCWARKKGICVYIVSQISSSGDLVSVGYPFVAISFRSTLTLVDNIC